MTTSVLWGGFVDYDDGAVTVSVASGACVRKFLMFSESVGDAQNYHSQQPVNILKGIMFGAKYVTY